MKLDTHVHTSPGSRCSRMSISTYLEALAKMKPPVACVTNHGNMDDFDELARLAPEGQVIIPGVEITSTEGDFIIFSQDYGFLRTLSSSQPLPEPDERPPGTAVVWAHPLAGSPGGVRMSKEYLSRVARRVDGIEIFNGNWPDEEASRLARRVAARHGLAEIGGSDTHRVESLYRCWTELPEVGSAGELVSAILSRKTLAYKRNGKGL